MVSSHELPKKRARSLVEPEPGILLSFLSGAFLVTYGHATGDAGAMGNWAQFTEMAVRLGAQSL